MWVIQTGPKRPSVASCAHRLGQRRHFARSPDDPALVLLQVIKREPRAVARALKAEPAHA
jgi:hypothetical protein